MGDHSQIEWTNATWNPVTGCTKVSPGCAHCYAESITLRFGRGGPFLPGKGTVLLQPHRLRLPLSWRSPRRIFVNSMSDLFHEQVPLTFIQSVFSVMNKADWHTFQVLTKRPERLAQLAGFLSWSKNIWAGVSAENQRWLDIRAPILKEIPAAVRFLSCEPLLGPMDVSRHLDYIGWVIVGGESGNGARPMSVSWAQRVRDDCIAQRVPFFFKQWGGRTHAAGGRLLDGEEWGELPDETRLATVPELVASGELAVEGVRA